MSAPPGRSAKVHSLSGRVNALKFMQRASPSTTPTKPTASSVSSPAPASPSPSVPGSPSVGGEEEQWALSPAAIAKLRARAQGKGKQKGPVIEQEAGFDAWLISTNKEASSARQTFGRLGKQKQEEGEESEKKKRSRGQADDGEEPEFDEDESEEETPKGFVKPGSLGNKSKKVKGSESKEQAGSSSSSKKARKDKGRGSKDQDKVVYARKRGGKLGISGGGR